MWNWIKGQFAGQAAISLAEKMLVKSSDKESLEAAVEYARRAGQEFAQINEFPDQIEAMKIETRGLEMLGQWAASVTRLEEALKLAESHANPLVQFELRGLLTDACRNAGYFGRALETGAKNVAAGKHLGPHADLLASLSLAHLYTDAGMHHAIIDLLSPLLATLAQLDIPFMASSAYLFVATARASLGQTDEAMEDFSAALLIAEKEQNAQQVAEVCSAIGMFHFTNHRSLDAAAEAFQRAIQIQQTLPIHKANLGYSLLSLGVVEWFRGDIAQALYFVESALRIADTQNNLAVTAHALARLGAMYLSISQLDRAEIHLDNAIELWEATRRNVGPNDSMKRSFGDIIALAYEQRIAAAVDRNDAKKVLEISEKSRSRALADIISASGAENSDIPSVIDLAIFAEKTKGTYLEYSSSFRQELKNGKLVHRRELAISVLLPDGRIELRRVDGDWFHQEFEDYFATFPINPLYGGSWFVFRPDNEFLKANEDKWLRSLYRLLIEPIEDLLPADAGDLVTVIPYYDIFEVPFAALIDSKTKRFVETHTLMLAPSMSVLIGLNSKTTAPAGRSALAIGVSKPSASLKLQPILDAESEARHVAKIHQGLVLAGPDGAKSRVLELAPDFRILHFSTHALLDRKDGKGTPGAIALTPENDDDDGLLWSDELAGIRWNADLVVLSACDTGRGKFSTDGVLGLTRAVFATGVSSVVAALAPVPDTSTRKLMIAFHIELHKTGDKAGALRTAMMDLIGLRYNVNDWASFAVVGKRYTALRP